MCLMEDYVKGLVDSGEVDPNDVSDIIKETKEEKELMGAKKVSSSATPQGTGQIDTRTMIANKAQSKASEDF